jgi:hypothetical protein
MDYLITGIAVGYFLNPLLASAIAIVSNAWKGTGSTCSGNCNQGRNCNCGGNK